MSHTGEPGVRGPAGTPYPPPEEHACESNTVWKMALYKEIPSVSSMWLAAWVPDPKKYRMTILWHQCNGQWTLDKRGEIPTNAPDWYSEFPCWPPPLPEDYYGFGPADPTGAAGS